MGAEPVIRVDELAKRYGMRRVLNGLSLVVDPGEAVAVVGPNGSGKTTLLSIVAGQRPPDAGVVSIDGEDPFESGGRALARLGFVPEDPFLYDELTVAEHLDFVAAVRRLGPEQARALGGMILERLGSPGALERRTGELSRGNRRKTALALALLHDPPAIVLDEGFDGLDSGAVTGLIELLRERLDRGAALLFSSHVAHPVGALAHRILELEENGVWRVRVGG